MSLNLTILFEGLHSLDEQYLLLGNYIDKEKLEEGINDIVLKSLKYEHDIDHVSLVILRHWIPSLHRFVEKRKDLLQFYPYDLDLEIQSLLVKAGYPETESYSDE